MVTQGQKTQHIKTSGTSKQDITQEQRSEASMEREREMFAPSGGHGMDSSLKNVKMSINNTRDKDKGSHMTTRHHSNNRRHAPLGFLAFFFLPETQKIRLACRWESLRHSNHTTLHNLLQLCTGQKEEMRSEEG